MQAFQDENDSLKGKLAKSGATEVEALRAALAQVEGAKARAEARAESAAADAKEAARKLRVAENGLKTERTLRATEKTESDEQRASAAAALDKLAGEAAASARDAAARIEADAKALAALRRNVEDLEKELDKQRVVAATYKEANERDAGAADKLERERSILAERLGRMNRSQYEMGTRCAELEAEVESAKRATADLEQAATQTPREAPRRPPDLEQAATQTERDGDDGEAVAAERDALLAKCEALERRLAESHRGITVKPSPPSADAPFGDYVGIKRENHKLRQELQDLRQAHVQLAEAAPAAGPGAAGGPRHRGARVAAGKAPALPGIAGPRRATRA